MYQQLIIVNSKDRSLGVAENFVYNLSQYNPVKVRGYRINKVTIPMSFYTTPAQTFQLIYAYLGTVSPVTYTLSIPGGTYTPAAIVLLLQAASDSTVGSGELVWSYTNGVFNVITSNSLYKIQLLWNINNLTATKQYESMGVQLGFVQEGSTYVPLPFNDTFSSLYYPNLSGGANFYITSSYLQLYQSSYFNLLPANVIQTIPLTSPVGNWSIWQNSIETYFKTNSSVSFGNIDFQLVDYYGNVVNLNGLNWEFEIQIFHEI